MPEPGPSWSISPEQWQAQIDYDSWNDTYTPDDGIALHHGGSNDYRAGRAPYSMAEEMALMRAWERYHLSKNWRGFAYGYGLGQTGNLYRGRGWNTYGAHTGDVDGDGISNNTEQIPVVFLGSGNHHSLSPAAQATLERYRRYAEGVSDRILILRGHQELRGIQTSCPGPLLMNYVRANRLLEEEVAQFTEEEVAQLRALLPWADDTLQKIHTVATEERINVTNIFRRLIRWGKAGGVPSSDETARRAIARVATDLETVKAGLRKAGE